MRKIVSTKKIPAKKHKTRVATARVRREETLPFPETPPGNHYDDQVSNNALHAEDLFSRFTADIIKEDVTFTR